MFTCLVYHGLSDCQFGSEPTQYTIRFEVFHEHMEWLRRNHYVVEDFNKLRIRLVKGEAFPNRYVVLTFDDGYRTNLLVTSFLSGVGYSSTFFLTAEYCQSGGKYFANEDEIQQLVTDGMHSVGTHGYAHRPFGVLSKVDLISEMTRSKMWLEQIVGQPIEFVAAPEGSISRLVIKQSSALGYRLIGTSVQRQNSRSVLESTGIVNRIGIRRTWDMDTFVAIVKGEPGLYKRRQVRALLLALPKRMLWHYTEIRAKLRRYS